MEDWVSEVKQRALTGKPPVSGGRTTKLNKVSFDDLVFIPKQLTGRPVDYFREEIVSETIIGKSSKHPLKLKIPIMIGAMSFGALSKEAKIALAKGASLAGTSTNTGEGGMLPEERESANILIVQYSTGRFGITDEVLKAADAIEIKIGQGAKPGCYSPDHEIFTENGFKNVNSIKVGERLWSVNPETNELELARVVKLHQYFHNSPMVYAKSKSVDFLVTPDHNLPIKERASGKWKFIKAKDALEMCEIRTSKKFLWSTKERPPSIIKIPKIPKTTWHQKEYDSFPLKEWLQLSAWFVSEGFFSEDRRIEISQTKKENRKEIKSLLSEMSIDFKERKDRFVIYSKQIGEFLEKEFGNRSEEKKIPKWIRNLPQKHLSLFLETLVRGDGSKKKNRKNLMTYFTSSNTLMNNVIETAMKLGKAVSLSKDENTFEICIRSGKLWHGLSCNCKKKSWQKRATLIGIDDYKGFVYCPELDKNHTLIIMRNGKVSLNGNSGGMLPADKVTEDIAKIRNVPMGKDVHSPPYHPDIFSVDDLRKKVKWLRELTGGKPIIIKLGAGNVEEDVKLAMKAEPDAIAVDGMEGGTGAAPKIMLDDFGIPTLAAVVKARRAMGNAKQELIVAGGLSKGADVAKALALGADAVYMATPCLVAMGCIYCKMCYKGKCPVGITTQDPELRAKLSIDDAAKNVANFLNACTEEVKMAAGACGKRNIHGLNREDLRSISLIAKEVTGIPLV